MELDNSYTLATGIPALVAVVSIMCSYFALQQKQPNLELKTRPKQLLGYLLSDISAPQVLI